MRIQTPSPAASRRNVALLLLPVVGLLQLTHLGALVFLRRPLLVSNVLQLLCSATALCVCLAQVPFVREPAGRRCWRALAVAFGIWSVAQGVFLILLRIPCPHATAAPLDHYLWPLFGLPILLAVNTFNDKTADHVLWLDRVQGVLFVVVLYLATFLPGVHLGMYTCLLIQGVALLLACLLRLATASTEGERRFFLRLGLYLGAYAPFTVLGGLLHAHGHPPGGLVDLVWTTPITFFCTLVLIDAIWPGNAHGRDRMVSAARNLQGLNAALLALASIGVAVYLAVYAPLIGGVCIALAFGLFALRTNARELAWYTAHGQLEETVVQDALTGLGNRILLRRALEQRLADRSAATVLLFVDLDRFKSINDSLGHAIGDQLLVEVGHRLRNAAPSGAVVCRLGGDEFVLLTSLDDPGAAEAAGERLRTALGRPFHLGRHDVSCTGSIGVVQATSGENVDDLLRTADHAMYHAKELGKNRVQLFDAALRTRISNRCRQEAELRACVEAKDIQVAFQPIYSVENAGICGFEALARWSHPTLGEVAPADFIPLAEETGLIHALGLQVLEKASAQVARWNRTWRSALSVSVNVSPCQFTDSRLMASLLDILDRTGLPPTLLRLEVTETALLTETHLVRHTLEQARAHGIRISLDDFGTGYSSLSFLLSLPVDEVKVDRSFVSHMHRDPDRQELVRTVVHLGHTLGKRVVAEGVETEQDLVGLTEMGCECMQGYHISRPLLAEAMEARLPLLLTGGVHQSASAAAPGTPADWTLPTPNMAELLLTADLLA